MIDVSSITINSHAVSSPNVVTGKADESTLLPIAEPIDKDSKVLRVNSAGANIDAVVGAAGDPVTALKKQIEEAPKLLAEQQAQLASAQRSQDNEQKAQKVMEIQNQIAVTSSNLQVLQAALLQAMFSVDTHA
jgi:hypothetical protein